MKGKKIILIDDEPDILELLKYSLNNKGAYIETYLSANEAYQQLSNKQYDLIVSDWMMPEMDGIELCQKLKLTAINNNTPIVMLTCKSSDLDKKIAKEAGANYFYSKPIGIQQLVKELLKITTLN